MGISKYIEECCELWNEEGMTSLLEWFVKWGDADWLDDTIPEGGFRATTRDDLTMRSAFEFLKEQGRLDAEQLELLSKWDALWAPYRERGVFFPRGGPSSKRRALVWWKRERESATEDLGIPIPRSHWWMWGDEWDGYEYDY